MVKKRQNIQGARWRRLDNTAKLFPVIASENLSNVFRVSVTLREEVEQELLQQALEEVLPFFEGFQVKLRRGFFWYYFESNKRTPVVEKESTDPCRFIDPHSNQLFLFRVTYYKCRIHLEVFHALADGLGAINFLKALTYRYLKLTRREGGQYAPEPEHAGRRYGRTVEDSYLRHYVRGEKRSYASRDAYRLTGDYLMLDGQNILHGYLPLTELKSVCKRYGVSITKYLAALLIWSVYQIYLDGKPDEKPVGINLPINLRSFFDSETEANFFAVTVIDYLFSGENCTFPMVLDFVAKQMDEKIVREKMEETISYNVSGEKKWYVRGAPLFLKKAVLSLIFMRSSRAHTLTLSNLGVIHVEPEFEAEIRNFLVVIGVSGRQKMKCSVCAYGGQLAVSFNSVFQDTRLQEFFFQCLREEGISVELESNGNPKPDHDKGNYPKVAYNASQFKRFCTAFYLILFAVAAILWAVNVITFQGTWWSWIAIASIFYVVMTVRYSLTRHANLAFKLVIQSLGAQLLLIIIDQVSGYRGWSVNYAIPSLILFDVLAIVCLIVVNRLNWQSYFMYQIALTIFSFLPIVFWAAGWIDRPIMAIITVIISVVILGITILLGDRSVKTELIRRFHL